jgi:FkbM family methyltransferase
MKSLIIRVTLLFGWLLNKGVSFIGRRWPLGAILIKDSLSQAETFKNVSHISTSKKVIELKLLTPNSINLYRATTFSTKEPETLGWIDEFGGKGAIFFDVGANVGLYSLYYAKQFSEKVYAFECWIFNLKILGINAYNNGLSDLITIMPMPLTNQIIHSSFNLSTIVEGGAVSTFGEEIGHDGLPLDVNFRFKTIGVPLDMLFTTGMIQDQPSILKIDVDGIEHLILSGATQILKNPRLKSVLVEVDDHFDRLSAQVSDILMSSGFSFREKKHSAIFDGGNFSHSYNQIWIRRNG